MMQHKQNLLAILYYYAPTGIEQEQIANEFRSMESDGMSDDYIVKTLCGWIYDGISYGNWPWVNVSTINRTIRTGLEGG